TGKEQFISLLAAVLLLLSSVPTFALDQARLEADVLSGVLSPAEAAQIRALSAMQPAAVPPAYQAPSTGLTKSATVEIRDAWLIRQQQPELLAKYAGVLDTRPTTDYVYDSPGGYFRLHYDTSGTNAVLAGDTNANQIPDLVERAAVLADSVRAYEIDQLGYLPPPSDGTLGGGVDQYDIYFQSMQVYGYTSPESPGPAAWDDYTSHIVVNSTFLNAADNDDPEGTVIGALKVTLAHEFFHVIHFGLNVWVASYWLEMSGTWMEEMAFPVVNDNYQYLDEFFNDPQEGLQHDGLHRYGSFIWPKFLEETQGIDVVRDIWHHCRIATAYNSMVFILDSLGTYFPREFQRFLCWNYLTGSRAAAGYYEDAADYPEVRVLRSHTIVPDSNWFSTEPPEPLGSNYLEIISPGDLEQIFTFELDGNPGVAWSLSYIVDRGGGVYDDTVVTSVSNGEGKIYVPYFEEVERVIVIPAVTSNFGAATNFFYDLYIRPLGDADGNHVLNIADVTYIIAYIFNGGANSYPAAAMDANCDRIVNVTDAIFLINYIFGSGQAPCPIVE
ncbi:MAG: MXAN_6640 family putative metalloprotease, partial [bacterium]